ncbi:hypothetical protein D1007_23714 [Hordeum vulgare]|nr:hypothetical protein D1007_23714 [Hordeum vulgare]
MTSSVPWHGGEALLPVEDGVGPPRPGGVVCGGCRATREDQEARELAAEAAAEAYMVEIRRELPHLVGAERAFFVEHDWEAIVISDDELQGGEQGGEKEHEFNIEEWRRTFPVETILDQCKCMLLRDVLGIG